MSESYFGLNGTEQRLVAELERARHPEVSVLRRSLAVGAFLQGNLSLRQASDLAGIRPADFSELLRSYGPRLQDLAGMTTAPPPAPLISVVIPVYNEENNLTKLWERLQPALSDLGSYEVIFVNDGSGDDSAAVIRKICATDPAVKLVSLSRNFGHQAALSAGIDYARGECVALMDADLQDPPELLEEFVKQWRAGYRVVYAVRQRRKEALLKRAAYYTFYRTLKRLANIDIPLDAGDFCLMDRRVVERLRTLPEKNRFLRGLRSWVGFRQVGVLYERPARHAGSPKYTVRKLTKLAFDGLLAFTSVPLRLASYLGFATAAAGVIYLFFAIGARLFTGSVPPGWTSVIAIILILGGVQLLLIGVLGEYVARVYDETKQRPVYVVEEVRGVD